MQNEQRVDRLISSYKAARMLGICRRTLIELPLPHIEIQRRDRVLRRYQESAVKAYVQANMKHAVNEVGA
ncbi:hypothetical protein [Thiothrix lacustris]|uniref:hypothetical protein n=1 Tax=Thiothrix lacustris TaxID=525917 RepID=UPI00048EDB02|nr:hypothetical protein [Thiothrix lacustris]